ncbi:MAG: caspase family protein [Hyphomicrobiaceae bacterium]
MRLDRLAGIWLLFLLTAVPAWAQHQRAALVIGNSDYRHTRALPTPKNDAAALAKLLKDSGFEVVSKIDLDYRAMREAIRTFGETAQNADIALVYFAGHGLEIGSENYLVPIDAKLARDVDLEYEAVTLASVLTTLGSRRRLTLAILDSCRNNPLSDKIALRGGATRSVTRGLARPEPKGDVLVAYSAKHGTLASDGDGGAHSPYAEALLKHIATPEIDVRLMFGQVRDQVLKATQRQSAPQEPHIYGSLGGDTVSLVPRKAPSAPPPPLPQTVPPSLQSYEQQAELAFWATVKDSNDPAMLRSYLDRFPSGTFAGLARTMIARLQQEAEQRAVQAAREAEARKAQAAKEAAEAQRADAERRAREAEAAKQRDQLRSAQEEARQAREALKAAERDRIAAERAAEEARRIADALQAQRAGEAAKSSGQAPAPKPPTSAQPAEKKKTDRVAVAPPPPAAVRPFGKSPRGFQLTANSRINGGSSGSYQMVASKEECERRCTQSWNCVAYEHHSGWKICNVFEIVVALEPASGWSAGTTADARPQSAQPAPTPPRPATGPPPIRMTALGTSAKGFKLTANSRIVGGSLGSYQSVFSKEDCERRCTQMRKCIAYEQHSGLGVCNIFEIVNRLDVDAGWQTGVR